MKIGIIGLGLIGGSIGRAIVKNTDNTVYAADSDENTMLKGALLRAYHETLDTDNAKELDMLLICVYPEGVKNIIDSYAPLLKDGAIVMDCAGIKRGICAYMEKAHKKYPELNFIGGHPMAGREYSGVEHSTASLLEHATCLLVPVHTPIEPLVTVKELFMNLGCDGVVVTTAEEHDKIIAYTSQLAHIVSSAYVMSPSAQTHYGFSANSFRDMTRVARLNPDMWTDLMINNSDFLSAEIEAVTARLKLLGDAVKNKDADALRKLLSEGNETKLALESGKAKKRSEAMH